MVSKKNIYQKKKQEKNFQAELIQIQPIFVQSYSWGKRLTRNFQRVNFGMKTHFFGSEIAQTVDFLSIQRKLTRISTLISDFGLISGMIRSDFT